MLRELLQQWKDRDSFVRFCKSNGITGEPASCEHCIVANAIRSCNGEDVNVMPAHIGEGKGYIVAGDEKLDLPPHLNEIALEFDRMFEDDDPNGNLPLALFAPDYVPGRNDEDDYDSYGDDDDGSDDPDF